MAERGCPLEAVPLPAEVRESLAELELELSEGEHLGALDPAPHPRRALRGLGTPVWSLIPGPCSWPPPGPPRTRDPGPASRDRKGTPAFGRLAGRCAWGGLASGGKPHGKDCSVRAVVPAQGGASAPRQPLRLQPRVPGFPPP